MSIDYLNKAFKAKVGKSSTKFVLVALADFANVMNPHEGL